MFWLYIPPIIFIAALVALVVVMGRKTADLKKAGSLRSVPASSNFGMSIARRTKMLSSTGLRLLEWLIGNIKSGAKKTETGLTDYLGKLKERRLGKKRDERTLGANEAETDHKEQVVFNDAHVYRGQAKFQGSEESGVGPIQSMDVLPGEVVVKKKIEPAPVRALPEINPEDKVREEALIHRIAENPKDLEAYRELGDYYLGTGNLKDAKDSFKMVLKLRPRDLKAKSSLREIEMRMRLGS